MSFTPTRYHDVVAPAQIKAFTDPLRLRVLELLTQRSATNQQLADELQQPHAKILYHVRVLVDAGLVKLVDTRVKGGNVEKYYRAVARNFLLRSSNVLSSEQRLSLVSSDVEVLRQELLASVARTSDQPVLSLRKALRLTESELAEFRARLHGLLEEYEDRGADPAAGVQFVAFLYQDPPAEGDGSQTEIDEGSTDD